MSGEDIEITSQDYNLRQEGVLWSFFFFCASWWNMIMYGWRWQMISENFASFFSRVRKKTADHSAGVTWHFAEYHVYNNKLGSDVCRVLIRIATFL